MKIKFLLAGFLLSTFAYSQNYSDPVFVSFGEEVSKQFKSFSCFDHLNPSGLIVKEDFCSMTKEHCEMSESIIGNKEVSIRVNTSLSLKNTLDKYPLKFQLGSNHTGDFKKISNDGLTYSSEEILPVGAKITIFQYISDSSLFNVLYQGFVPKDGIIPILENRASNSHLEIKKDDVNVKARFLGVDINGSSTTFKIAEGQYEVFYDLGNYKSKVVTVNVLPHVKTTVDSHYPNEYGKYSINRKLENDRIILTPVLNAQPSASILFSTIYENKSEVMSKKINKASLIKGEIIIADHDAINTFRNENKINIKLSGECLIAKENVSGAKIPLYSDNEGIHHAGDLIFEKVFTTVSIFYKNGSHKEKIIFNGPKEGSCRRSDELILLTLSYGSNKGLQNIGPGPWGKEGWVNSKSYSLFKDKLPMMYAFQGKSPVTFKKGKEIGEFKLIYHHPEKDVSFVGDTKDLWTSEGKFIPYFSCESVL